jgi:hypothetical protein
VEKRASEGKTHNMAMQKPGAGVVGEESDDHPTRCRQDCDISARRVDKIERVCSGGVESIAGVSAEEVEVMAFIES